MKNSFYFLVCLLFVCFISCDSEPVDSEFLDLNYEFVETSPAEIVIFEGEVQESVGDNSRGLFRCGVTGPNCASPNQSLTYTYFTSTPNPSIVWSVDSGNISIASGQGTNTVTLSFGSSFTGGYVTVLGSGTPNCAVTFEILACGGNDCGYALGVLDEYIDGTQSGADYVYLLAGGNFPTGTTYDWIIKRQDGSIQLYGPSTSNPRLVVASINNRITEATVTAVFSNCTKTATNIFDCAIPHADMNGDLFPECGGLGGGGLGFN